MRSPDVRGVARRPLSRRRILRGAAAGSLGLLGAALVGCGADDAAPAASSSPADSAGPRATPTTPTAAAGVSRGGVLRVGQAGEIAAGGTHEPHMGSGSGRYQYAYMVMDNLVMYDEKGDLDPARSLAESWEYAEPTRLIFKLRPGVTFHDGSEFNAEVAAWNIDRARSPEATSSRSDLVNVTGVDVVAEHELVLNLSEPHAGLLHLLGDFGGFMMSRAAADGVAWEVFDRNPVGTGPMRFKSWTSDVAITYERNESYWRRDAQGQPLPYLDGVEVRFLPETTVRMAALEAGEIDITPTPPIDVARLNENLNLHAARFDGSFTDGFFLNHAFPPADDLRFRMALDHAWDRQSFIQNFRTGQEREAAMIMTPPTFWWSDKVKSRAFDPAEVRRLLEASGLPEDEWSVLMQPLSATVLETDEFWQESARRAGIEVVLNPPEQGALLRMYKNQGGDTPAAIAFTGRALRVDPDATMTSTYTEKGSHNLCGCPTLGVEDLVVAMRRELDRERRKEIYIELEQAARDNVYSFMPIAYQILFHHASLKVGGLESYFLGDAKPRYANVWLSS